MEALNLRGLFSISNNYFEIKKHVLDFNLNLSKNISDSVLELKIFN